MARFDIYSKDGQSVRYSGKMKFLGTYMKPGMLEFREVSSPTPIDFMAGDYVVYPRTGYTYRIYNVPQVKKQARRNEYGGAFVYQNVQLFDASKMLEYCPFRDLVAGDNRIHFSTQPSISTYEGCDGLARRFEACLRDQYDVNGAQSWSVRIATDSENPDLHALMLEPREFTVSGVNILQCLDKIYEIWPEVGWIYKVENGIDTIVIGGGGSNANEGTYAYGKGMGLTSLTRTMANADEMANRIYAYGSSRNMLPRWYNSQEIKDAESVDIQNLMIPVEDWGTTEVDGTPLPDAAKAYIEDTDSIAKIGLRPKTVYFDGSSEYPEIYPSIRETTIKMVRDALGSSSEQYYPSTSVYLNENARVDRLLAAPATFDSGLAGDTPGRANVESDSLLFAASNSFTMLAGLTHYPFYHYQGVWHPDSTGYRAVSFFLDLNGSLQLEGVESCEVSLTVKDPSYQGPVIAGCNYELTPDADGVIHFSGKDVVSDKVNVLNVGYIVNVDISVNMAPQGSDKTGTYNVVGNVGFSVQNSRAKTFKVSLRQIGFNITDRALLGDGKSIAMRTGKCAGRTFAIKSCVYVASTDSWELECWRSEDESLSQWFPNTDYPVRGLENAGESDEYPGDEFVLLDIAMPDIYILMAEIKLLAAAEELLADAAVERWQYVPEIDAKFMLENSRVIRAGDFLALIDGDLIGDGGGGEIQYFRTSSEDYLLTSGGDRILLSGSGGVTRSIVDSITISEEDAAIPTYKVTLRDRKRKTWTESESAPSISSKPVSNATQDSVVQLSSSAGESFFMLDENGNITLKEQYKNFWVPGWIAAGGVGAEGGGGYVPCLNDLDDVSVSNLQAGDLLQWDGTGWVNFAKSSIAALTQYASYSRLDVGGVSVSFYDKDQVDLKIGAVNPFDYIDVQTLPTADATTLGKIYMLGPDANNVYTLYYTKEESGSYSWVSFGTTQVNLSGYTTNEAFAQETDRVENYQQLVANGGVYRVKLDETKRIDESGMVQRRTNSDQNYAVLTELSVNDVYSISINPKYKYEFLWHAKASLVTDQFTRAGVWITGQTILSSLPFYADADRLRIRIYSEDSEGDPVVFATMVDELNPVITTWKQLLEPIPAQVEVLRSGSLVTPGSYPSNTRLFDTSIAKAGDIVNYELDNTNPAGGFSQYFAIGFYDSEGTRLTYIGYDGSALSGAYTVRGSMQIPAGFSYAAVTDWGGLTVIRMTTNESLDAVYSKLNETIQKNALFDDEISLDIASGAELSQNIRVADVPFDKGGLPEYLYIKCDAVSNNNLADYPLRFDCYKMVGMTLTRFAYRFYHKSNIGRYVKFDLPSDTEAVRLIASVTVASTASAQTVTYTGAKLCLSPSDKEFSISATTFVREHDEYGPGVYADEIEDTVNKIVALSVKPSLVLNILTDTHENRQLKASVDITAMTLNNVKAVSRKAFADGLVHMGDILAAGQSSQYLTWGEVNNHLSEYVGRLRELNEHCFVCVGNHDGLEGNYVDEAHTYGSLEQFNEDYVVRDGIAPWFYKDYDKIKTRVAFLAVPSRDCVANGSLRYGIGENQMRWIAGTVLGVPDGWNVLFFSHIHPYSGFEAGDATIFAGLTTAFCNRTTYSYNGDYSLSVDYSGRTSGKVVALVAGHTHADAVIDDATVFTSYSLSFPIIVNASSNRLVGGNQDPGYTNPTRIENTISEDLWDTLVYRPDLDKIYMVRFGAGNDREIDV